MARASGETGSAELAAGGAEQPTADQDLPFRAVGFLLSSLGYAISARFSARLAPLELEPREFALLRGIGASEGRSQQAIGQRLGIPPSRMVGLVDDLQERQLLERRPSPDDRRVNALHLTPTGSELLARAMRLAAAFDSELTQGMSSQERLELVALLDRVALQLGVPAGVHGSQVVEPERC